MIQSWAADFLDRSPMFLPLRFHGSALAGANWPTVANLQRLLDDRDPPVRSGGGMPLRFITPRLKGGAFEEKYETRIYLRGEVEVRPENWHDLMNALVWLTFPLSKAALNARHYGALQQQQIARAPNRGPLQDAMTLFDEGGVIVVSSDPGLLQMLREFSWKELFWGNRAHLKSRMRFFLFGHALYEKALRPFTGITARGILFEVGADFMVADTIAQIANLDTLLAGRLLDTTVWKSTRELAPVPVLGVPGWCAENESGAYYDNKDYFRSGRGGV